MRSLEKSRTRWQVTQQRATNLEELRKAVRSDGDDDPCKAGLRSVCWKTTDITGWSRTLLDSRSAYTSLREHFMRYLENPDELGSSLDPLDDDRHSPWNTLRQDEETRAEIFQDVERCMPDEPYFRQPSTQRLMLDILFVFCKINQDIGYRQGMHEILAPILWVVEQDAIDYEDAIEQRNTDADALLQQTLDPVYIEHDAFTILSLIMRTAKSFYELGEPDRRSSNLSTGMGSSQPGTSPIVERSKRIHEVYLARVDPALAKHLTDIEVLPQIFLIRWIRLLFGREFPFDDLLALWDVLLAEDPALDLVDMICVAMLLRIRWQLIEANYSIALMLLLKYPSPPSPYGPYTFVDDAIYLRDNFNAVGGSKIITKYGGKAPPQASLGSMPPTASDQSRESKQKLSRTRSPLSSPARFLQQQGGVEALLHGAAKGVFDRGEKLGINQAVRDAVGEVKKNMQGLQSPRHNSSIRRSSDVMRWSLDKGRSVPSTKTSVAVLHERNLRLSRMLEQAMADLRAVSVSSDGDKEDYVKAIELAIAKVDFVKVYLEDSRMSLPEEEAQPTPSSESLTGPTTGPEPSQTLSKSVSTSEPVQLVSESDKNVSGTSDKMPLSVPMSRSSLAIKDSTTTSSSSGVTGDPNEVFSPETPVAIPDRPKPPVPTRSSIANSSFSWMLEPDVPSMPSQNSLPPKSVPPFIKSGKRPISGPNREKAAFLFGDDGGDSDLMGARPPLLADTQEGFKLGTIRSKDDR